MNGEREKLEKRDRCKHSMCYRNLFWPELEENLCPWIKVQQEAENFVSTTKIRLKAKKKKKKKNSEMRITDFVCTTAATILCKEIIFACT